jgi:hypothetical protein
MDFSQIQRLLGQRANSSPLGDSPQPDTAEKVQISSLSLLKMLKHGKFQNIF